MSSTNTFNNFFTTVWGSLDDILLCAGVLLVSIPIFFTCSGVIHTYFETSIYVAQSINFICIFSLFAFIFGHLVGESVAISLFGGFSVGIGYALQPYIVSLLSGITYYSSSMLKEGDIIVLNERQYLIQSNGILYIIAEEIRKEEYKTENDSSPPPLIVYLPNSMFQSMELKCIPKEKQKFINKKT